MLPNCDAGEDSWESLGLQGVQSIQRKSTINIHWKDWRWSCNPLATWCKEPAHWKRPWCWERLRAGEEKGDRGWDGWIASPTQWTWIWAKYREAWRAVVQGVTKSQTQLSHWTTTKAAAARLCPAWVVRTRVWDGDWTSRVCRACSKQALANLQEALIWPLASNWLLKHPGWAQQVAPFHSRLPSFTPGKVRVMAVTHGGATCKAC